MVENRVLKLLKNFKENATHFKTKQRQKTTTTKNKKQTKQKQKTNQKQQQLKTQKKKKKKCSSFCIQDNPFFVVVFRFVAVVVSFSLMDH